MTTENTAVTTELEAQIAIAEKAEQDRVTLPSRIREALGKAGIEATVKTNPNFRYDISYFATTAYNDKEALDQLASFTTAVADVVTNLAANNSLGRVEVLHNDYSLNTDGTGSLLTLRVKFPEYRAEESKKVGQVVANRPVKAAKVAKAAKQPKAAKIDPMAEYVDETLAAYAAGITFQVEEVEAKPEKPARKRDSKGHFVKAA